MVKTKNNRAITLIALVVTIIIILILAGVTIGFTTNGTGLFDKAKLATDEYNNSVNKENTELEKASNEIDDHIEGYRDYRSEIDYLQAQINELKLRSRNLDYTRTSNITFTNNAVTITEDGVVFFRPYCGASAGLEVTGYVDGVVVGKSTIQNNTRMTWTIPVAAGNVFSWGCRYNTPTIEAIFVPYAQNVQNQE